MASQARGSSYHSQNQSPITPGTRSGPGSTMASPAGSVLLPPVEIEVSPAQSSRSTYSASSSYRRGHNDNDGEYNEKQQHQPPMVSSRKQAGASRTGGGSSRVHPDGGDPYGSEMLGVPRRQSELRRSASQLSLQVKRHGWFGRLR